MKATFPHYQFSLVSHRKSGHTHRDSYRNWGGQPLSYSKSSISNVRCHWVYRGDSGCLLDRRGKALLADLRNVA
jgi:hypothetical protein